MSDYDAIAAWYVESFMTGSPVHAIAMPALLELVGSVAGCKVCDLACGTGIAARALAARGAHVRGIDLSVRLLDIARAEESRQPLGISYMLGDVRRPHDDTMDGAFEGAVCSLALMDIDDLDLTFKSTARILRPGGWFVFTVTHPCFQGPESRWTGKAGGIVKREVRGYFREGYWRSDNPHGVRGQVGAHHRTLSTIVNTLIRAGFAIEGMSEPQPGDEIGRRVPGYSEVPAVWAVRSCKSRGSH